MSNGARPDPSPPPRRVLHNSGMFYLTIRKPMQRSKGHPGTPAFLNNDGLSGTIRLWTDPTSSEPCVSMRRS
jgi:hypothetical protein